MMIRSRISSSRYGELAERNSNKSKQPNAPSQNKGRDSKLFPGRIPHDGVTIISIIMSFVPSVTSIEKLS